MDTPGQQMLDVLSHRMKEEEENSGIKEVLDERVTSLGRQTGKNSWEDIYLVCECPI